MKFIALLCLFLPFAALAGPKTSSFLSISENRAANGQVNLFIRANTNFEKSYVVLDANFDGYPATLEHPAKDLWVFKVPGNGAHAISFLISLADARQTDRLSESLKVTEQTIASLRAEIAETSDPDDLAALEAELNKNLQLQTRLQAELEGLKNRIGRETYNFSSFTNLN
ncbi:MAG: hypothetical protein AB7K68_00760 [Bacteriovoracia bacterium]